METPTISKKQKKSTLSGKKKKTEVLKNVLMKPYQNYWPLLTPEDNNKLIETLKKYLPRIQASKLNISYKLIKDIPKIERKKFRESIYQETNETVLVEERQHFLFGVNDASKLLEERKASCVLISSEVQPHLLVQHILDQAVLYNVPVLVVKDLKLVCKNYCGRTGVVVTFKQSVKADSQLGMIVQTACNIFKHYPIPKSHINYNRQLLDLTAITIPDSEDESFSASNRLSLDEKNVSFHLKREDQKKRIFTPEKSIMKQASNSTFIDVSSVVVVCHKTNTKYESLKVKRLKGDKNRSKRKMERSKRK